MTHATRHHASETDHELIWPSDGDRLVALHQAQAVMASGERAAAERELESRQRRAASPAVIRREDLKFEASSIKGLQIAYVVAPHLGMEVRNVQAEVHRLLPGAHTEVVRNDEAVIHVLNGRGTSIVDGKTIEWGPHDSIHIPRGAWYQHYNASETEPSHLMVGRASPMIEQMAPYAREDFGDSYSDPPDDFMPQHPFTGERVAVGYVEGKKWMSGVHAAANHRVAEHDKRRSEARILIRAGEVAIERSQHKGDWIAGLIVRHLGFDNRVLMMSVFQQPPSAHTETHRHGEAIVYVLKGRGHSIIGGETYDWRQGDCIFVQPGQWHQHFNDDPDNVSQILALLINPLREYLTDGTEAVGIRPEAEYEPKEYSEDAGDWWR